MRNRLRERIVKGLNERGYQGKKASGWAYRGGRPEGEMLRPQDVCKRAAWEWVHWEQRDEGAGCWALGVEYQGGGCARGGPMNQDAKGPHPMRPDTDLPVRTHWAQSFQSGRA